MLNSRDITAVAQCRRRYYLVVFLAGSTTDPEDFEWPEPLEDTPPDIKDAICDISIGWKTAPTSATARRNLDHAATHLRHNEVARDALSVVDLAASKGREQTRIGYSPCLTETRAKSSSFVLVRGHDTSRVRNLILQDCSRLQGFTDQIFKRHSSVLSSRNHLEALGNAVTLPVARALIMQCLPHLCKK